MDAISLITCIENVFDGSERAGPSLRQFLLTDRYGMSREITAGEWRAAGERRVDSNWPEIPDAEIEECDCLLAHMGPDEFLYYLPAYLRYALKNHHRPIWETDVLGMTVSSLSPSTKDDRLRSYAIAQYAALNEAQREVIVQFLLFIANLDEDVRRPDAIKALTSYWQKDSGAIEGPGTAADSM